MSERAIYWMQDGEEFTGIYCHWSDHGFCSKVLFKEIYVRPDDVRELIALGALSFLYERLSPSEGTLHSFDDPAPRTTLAYHRDRGEPLEQLHASSVEEVIEKSKSAMANYTYLYNCQECTWYWKNINRKRGFSPIPKHACLETVIQACVDRERNRMLLAENEKLRAKIKQLEEDASAN